ncbi:MAG: tRNA pseudouridine(55) synthase TruB [bacterium]
MNSGFILINKHSGPTSHDVVDELRKITDIKKIGHAGTLDPLASGLMILGISREATRKIDQFVKLDKEYVADIKLGAQTDTYDREGQIIKNDFKAILEKEIKKVLKKFLGKQKQLPPMYSAKKIKGKKLYELARQGKEVERKPHNIEIYKIKLISYSWPELKIIINCSSGTYIRSLAHDIGQKLGCHAYLQELQRTKIGLFSLKQAVELNELNKKNYIKHLINIDQ